MTRGLALTLSVLLSGCVRNINVVHIEAVNGGSVEINQTIEGAEAVAGPLPPSAPDELPDSSLERPSGEAGGELAGAFGAAGVTIAVGDCLREQERLDYDHRYAESRADATVDSRTLIEVDGRVEAATTTLRTGDHALRVSKLGCGTERGGIDVRDGENRVYVRLDRDFASRAADLEGPAADIARLSMGSALAVPVEGDGLMAGGDISFSMSYPKFLVVPGMRLRVLHGVDDDSLSVGGALFGGFRVPFLVHFSVEATAAFAPMWLRKAAGGDGGVIGLEAGGALRVAPTCGFSIAATSHYAAYFATDVVPPGPAFIPGLQLGWSVWQSEECNRVGRFGIRPEVRRRSD